MKNESEMHWSRGQLEAVSNCPACACSRQNKKTFARHDNEGAIPDLWIMHQCPDCHSVWLDPRPDSISLPKAYDDYYTHHAEFSDVPLRGSRGLLWRLIHGYLNQRFGMNRHPSSKFGYLFFSLIEPWRLKLDFFGRHLPRINIRKKNRLLDIGCGNGGFLTRATEMGWQVKGCEIDPKAVVACKSIGLNVIQGDAYSADLANESFDVITMSHVIEHVYEQANLLKRAHDLLSPGGWLWLACPNPQSVGFKLFGATWHALHPPFHLCIPSQTILENWLKESGFSDIKFMRRGAHVRSVWKISQDIARREKIITLGRGQIFGWRLIVDTLATISPYGAEDTILIARKAS